MIAKKIFIADGSNKRFLSDFIIRSEQFTRVYNYVYDAGGIEGSIDPASGLYVRVTDAPTSVDLQTINKWDLVDNSISFYVAPYSGSRVWIEVATTAEEFGDTLIQPTVAQAEAARDAAAASAAAALISENGAAADAALTAADVVLTHADVVLTHADAAQTALDRIATAADKVATNADVVLTHADVVLTHADAAQTALDVIATAADVVSSGTNATNAQLRAWEAEAEKMTSDSYATEAEDVVVKVWTSDGDGTFTSTPTVEYSALHWAAKTEANLTIIPTPAFPADEGLALVARAAGNDWEKILGLPLETGNAHKTVTTDGVEGDSYWSPLVNNPIAIDADVTLSTGAHASIVEPTINDGITVTIPDGSTLVIL